MLAARSDAITINETTNEIWSILICSESDAQNCISKFKLLAKHNKGLLNLILIDLIEFADKVEDNLYVFYIINMNTSDGELLFNLF